MRITTKKNQFAQTYLKRLTALAGSNFKFITMETLNKEKVKNNILNYLKDLSILKNEQLILSDEDLKNYW